VDVPAELHREASKIDESDHNSLTKHDIHKIYREDEVAHLHSNLSRGNSLIKVEDGKLIHDPSVSRKTTALFGHKRSWAIPKKEYGNGTAKTLKPLFWGDKEVWKPKDDDGKKALDLKIPAFDAYNIPNTPRVPFTARTVLNDTLSGKANNGSKTAREEPNVGRFVRQPEYTPRNTGMVSSSLPWEPKTARPHAEHNTGSGSWFGGEFQNASPGGWKSSRLPSAFKNRPARNPPLAPDGRARLNSGFRLAQTGLG